MISRLLSLPPRATAARRSAGTIPAGITSSAPQQGCKPAGRGASNHIRHDAAMNFQALRELLRPAVGDLKDHCTNSSMPALCAQLGLPVPEEGGDKRGRLHAAFDAAADERIPEVAQRLIVRGHLVGQLRNEVQEFLWASGPAIELPKRARRELARALQRVDLFHSWEKFQELLSSLFIFRPDLSTWVFGSGEPDILEEIHRHFVRNPEDADVERLFDDLQVYKLSDNRFRRLIEGLASADVQIDAENQNAIVEAMNSVLRSSGAELRETGQDGGYPLFSLVALRAARGRPKNLIFASTTKPDIRFRDAVNNDIEIVSNPGAVLVYDRPLGRDGLRWRDLQLWWAEATAETDSERAKKALYLRLLSCLPDSSPPQRLLFKSYFSAFRDEIPGLPALLPEVWLHWDPKTVKQRGPQALLTHRMDFLMLLPGGGRVVIEVDGQQHYGDEGGRTDPHRYAQLAAGHRELTLAGYEVYRFGGVELHENYGVAAAKAFFERLFVQHGIRSSA